MQCVVQRDVPARYLIQIIEGHIPAVMVSGVLAEIRTARPTPNIRQSV